MFVDVAQAVKITDPKDNRAYSIKTINLLKAHGKSARESLLIPGYALNCTICNEQIV